MVPRLKPVKLARDNERKEKSSQEEGKRILGLWLGTNTGAVTDSYIHSRHSMNDMKGGRTHTCAVHAPSLVNEISASVNFHHMMRRSTVR